MPNNNKHRRGRLTHILMARLYRIMPLYVCQHEESGQKKEGSTHRQDSIGMCIRQVEQCVCVYVCVSK